jgi:hypothetical protein
MKFCHLQANEWNWRTSSYAKLIRFRRPKSICSPSFSDYRPKTNAAILSDTGHSKGQRHMGGIRQGKKSKL